MRSAFKFVYLIVFLGATVSIFTEAVASFDGYSKELTLDNQVFISLNAIFMGCVALHTIRIYVTLEMIDDRESLFNNFFDGQSTKNKIVEFFFRCLIIVVASYKMTRWSDSIDMAFFMIALYSSLVLWSMHIRFSFRDRKRNYLPTSLIGFGYSCIYLWTKSLETSTHIAISTMAIALASLLIIIDFSRDFKNNSAVYVQYVKSNFFVRNVFAKESREKS